MIRIAVIGYGYWGPNLVRNFSGANGAAVVAVCDTRPERLEAVSKIYPSIRTVTDFDLILADPSWKLAVIEHICQVLPKVGWETSRVRKVPLKGYNIVTYLMLNI